MMQSKAFGGVREKWLPLYQQLKKRVEERVGPFQEQPTSSTVLWKHTSTFAEVAARKDCMVLGFASDTLHEEWQADKYLQTSKNRVAHYFEVQDDSAFELLAQRIEAAYHLTKSARAVQKGPAIQYESVDAYIAAFPLDVQAVLEKVRATIKGAAPEAAEKISWQMPTYHLKENLVHFAAQKNHLGFYPSPEGIEFFKDRLSEYKTTKGGIQFPFSKPIPYDLIGEMTRYRVEKVKAE